MASPTPRERPISVATTATVQTEAPPPYSEYDDSFVPPPNEQTQAMLRGGYLNFQRQPDEASSREYSPATAYMRGRPFSRQHADMQTITIARAIHPSIKADGIPYPSEYPAVTARDVTPDDWSYFANCILRELEVPNVKGAVATPVTISEFRQRQDMIDVTIDQWNRGFFNPRSIHIVPAYSFRHMATAPETVRSASPTPTYRTERTVSQDDEIMTITIDTSPRSSRAATPDTIRELNTGDKTPPGVITPRTVDEELAPPRPTTTHRKNSIPRKPVLPKRPSELSLSQDRMLPQENTRPPPFKSEKARRNSASSLSSLSSESSLSSLSSDDDLANGNVPEIRRTLADEFKRDPRNKSHLKAALEKIRHDVAMQHKTTLSASKPRRAELQTAAKEHRKQMRGEMKELRREIREYQRAHRTAEKQNRKDRKVTKKEQKRIRKDVIDQTKRLKKEHKALRKDLRKGNAQPSPQQSPTGGLPLSSPSSSRLGQQGIGTGTGTWPMLGHNASAPHLETAATLPPASSRNLLGGEFAATTGFRGRGQVPPRAMSTVSFDGTGAAPQCSRSRSPRPPPLQQAAAADCPFSGRPTSRGDVGANNNNNNNNASCPSRRFGPAAFGNRAFGGGPIGMAKGFLMAQATNSLERIKLDVNHGTAPRAGEERHYASKERDGQETGVIKR